MSMKIEGSNRTSGVKGPSKTKKADGSGEFGSLLETEEAEEKSAPSGAGPVAALDALLTLQDVGGDAANAEKKAKRRALLLLDQLDKIKIGILSGNLAVKDLRDLSAMVTSRRDQVMDSTLAEVLDEIDLRAQIELAKLGL